MVLIPLDPGVGVLERLRFEGRLPHEQCVEDAADRPDVHLVAVTLLAKHLRRDVVGGAAKRPLPLAIGLDAGGEAKVSDFDLQEHKR